MLQIIRQEIAGTQQTIESLTQRIKEVLLPYENALELLKKVPGISSKSVEELVAEIGLDMGVFPTEKHLASWAGMSPGNNESAGKKKADGQHGETNKLKLC
jgi:transposase